MKIDDNIGLYNCLIKQLYFPFKTFTFRNQYVLIRLRIRDITHAHAKDSTEE